MSFQVKDFTSIVAGMINHLRGTNAQVTDFTIGSVARTLLEAPAIEIDQTYQQMRAGLMEAIPVATYQSFNFARLDAAPAAGVVTLTITASTQDTVLAAGALFTTPASPIAFVSTQDVTIAAGDTVGTVPVVAQTSGLAGNLGASTPFGIAPPPAGLLTATNAVAFTAGRDAETDDERKLRFADYVSTLQRGTPASLAYGARLATVSDANGNVTERVAAVSVYEPYVDDQTQPIGLVQVFVHNGVGSTSGALVAAANTILVGYTDAGGIKVAGYKAAGVKLVVQAAAETQISVAGVLTVAGGYTPATVAAAVTAALNAYILALDIGQPYVFAEAVRRVMSVAGVENVNFAATADQTVGKNAKAIPGTIAVTTA